MTKIESKKVQVPASADTIKAFLTNTDNIVHLLPSERISDWKSDGTTCTFKVQGAYTIGLTCIPSDSAEEVKYQSTAGSPFPFSLTAFLKPGEGGTEAWQVCHAELNPFLVMIVKEPLRNLFDYMAEKLTKQF
ncbi:MAG: hypothetical protein ACK500_07810 [Flavobacteriales bacterium]|jgi:hypothetical protein